MRVFRFDLKLTGRYTYEDPMCPSEWRGSGVYDLHETVSCDAIAYVCAEDVLEAREYISKCDFEDAPFETSEDDAVIDRIDYEITSYECMRYEDDEEGLVEVIYLSCPPIRNNDEYDYGHNIPKTQTNEYGEEI